MKIFAIVLFTLLSLDIGCTQVTQYELPSNVDSISGVVKAGRFGGTEKACTFDTEAMIGDRIKCNVGSVNLAVVNNENEYVWLDGYQCDAVEYFIKEVDGQSVSYETTNCTSEVLVEETYTFKGVLETRINQWYQGQQQDEVWLLNAIVR